MPHQTRYQFLLSAVTAHLNSDHPDECLEWPYASNGDGYGVVYVDGRHVSTHRFAYSYFVGEPGELDVMHSCDNPPCFNPRHLSKGTRAANIHDMISKGRDDRGVPAFGERHGMHKLTDDQVREILDLYKPGTPGRGLENPFGQRALAERFGVDKHTIREIVKGKAWSHVRS